MTHPIAAALADVEAWHQSTIRAGAAARLLMAAARQASITEPQLSRILGITIRDLQWLSRRGIGPVRSAEIGELINE